MVVLLMASLLSNGVAAAAETATPSPRPGAVAQAGFASVPALPGTVVPPPPGALQVVENPNAIAWTTQSQQYQAKPGEIEAKFRFGLTNVSKETVTIVGVHTSCGCTVAQLPSQPHSLVPFLSLTPYLQWFNVANRQRRHEILTLEHAIPYQVTAGCCTR